MEQGEKGMSNQLFLVLCVQDIHSFVSRSQSRLLCRLCRRFLMVLSSAVGVNSHDEVCRDESRG